MKRVHLESECKVKKADEDRKRNNNSNYNNKNEERKERPFRINTTEVTELLEEDNQKNE